MYDLLHLEELELDVWMLKVGGRGDGEGRCDIYCTVLYCRISDSGRWMYCVNLLDGVCLEICKSVT